MPDWQAIFPALEDGGIVAVGWVPPRAVGGGDISAAWRVATRTGAAFVKTARADDFERLDAEADGLEALRQAGALRVPEVLTCGTAGGDAFLA
ncbi:MAG TPA: fructosamine kinase family protein, partial [Woeseiaceae bacterium]|nr:fructosamine kinase family protein [Woeseiaceae bacterium]